MAKRRKHPKVVLAPEAERDIRRALKGGEEQFGKRAAIRYRALLKQELLDIEADPERPGSVERPEIMIAGARTYHLSFSRHRVASPGSVKVPRHFLVYRRTRAGHIEVGRILHDARDLERHLPQFYRSSPSHERRSARPTPSRSTTRSGRYPLTSVNGPYTRIRSMTLTIELSEEQMQALKAKAMARDISPEHYARQVLEQDLAPEWLRKSWESSKQNGLDRLSMDEIDAEIAAARTARRELRPGSGS